MLIVSQNKEKVFWMGQAFNALEYQETIDRKGKKEQVRHTICISDGCLEEVAEYESKERCLLVLKEFCTAYKRSCRIREYFDHAAQATIPVTCQTNSVFEFPEK